MLPRSAIAISVICVGGGGGVRGSGRSIGNVFVIMGDLKSTAEIFVINDKSEIVWIAVDATRWAYVRRWL